VRREKTRVNDNIKGKGGNGSETRAIGKVARPMVAERKRGRKPKRERSTKRWGTVFK